MTDVRRLVVFAEDFAAKLSQKDGEYGGKGEFELPEDHKAAVQVTKGGSCCKNCKFVDADKHECKNQYYIK